MVVPTTKQEVKVPKNDKVLLTEEQKMLVEDKGSKEEKERAGDEILRAVGEHFVRVVSEKQRDVNSVMRAIEMIQNYLTSSG